MKKSQLMTEAGIDHDYNFLSGIERDMGKAEKLFSETSDPIPMRQRGFTAQKSAVNYNQLEAAGVHVIRAPKGMSRQKENKSHRSSTKKSTGGQNIVWTVEWLGERGMRALTETSSTSQLTAANPFVHREKHKSKKRKHDSEIPENPTLPSSQDAKVSPTNHKSLKLDDQVVAEERVESVDEEPELSPLRPRGPGSSSQANEQPETKMAEAHHPDIGDDGNNSKSLGDEQHQFFLVKPRTSTSKQVLIPLDSLATLGQSLRGRTVLEFPTICVFPDSMQQLPEEYMMEEEYLKQESDEQKEFNDLIKELDPEILRRLQEDGTSREQENTKEPQVDDKAILDVLKKDFGAQI